MVLREKSFQMSSFDFEQSTEMEGGSSFLAKPGTYHIIVSLADPEPVTKDGKPMDGLRVQGEILDGTESSEKGKQVDFTLWRPKATDKNNGEMAKRKLTRFSYAMNFIDTHEPGQKVGIDCEACEGRQLVARFSEQERDGKTRVELHFSDIFHVDDAEVAEIPKSAQAISAIPKNFRRATVAKPKAVAAPSPKSNSKAMATAGAPNLDDI